MRAMAFFLIQRDGVDDFFEKLDELSVAHGI